MERKRCAPGVQSDYCRICNKPMMEGNGARWAHDNCIEKEKVRDGKIHLPSPDEIECMCAGFRATRGFNAEELGEDELITDGMRREDYCPRIHKLHAPNRRGRTVQ